MPEKNMGFDDKKTQEKLHAILADLLRSDDNAYCVECNAKGPRWASFSLGVFFCMRCAGIHRNLGVHISRVKSVNLDSWTPEQVAMMLEMGNSRGRAVYEAELPDNFRRPTTTPQLESFIRAKYETTKYLARGWVKPKPCTAAVMKMLEDKKRVTRTTDIKIAPPATTKNTVQKPISKLPQVKPSLPAPVTAAPTAAPAAPSSLLIDFAAPEPAAAALSPSSLVPPQLPTATSAAGPQQTAQPSVASSATPVTEQQTTQQQAQTGESSLLGGVGDAGAPGSSAKDSIMALFGSAPQQPAMQANMQGMQNQWQGGGGQPMWGMMGQNQQMSWQQNNVPTAWTNGQGNMMGAAPNGQINMMMGMPTSQASMMGNHANMQQGMVNGMPQGQGYGMQPTGFGNMMQGQAPQTLMGAQSSVPTAMRGVGPISSNNSTSFCGVMSSTSSSQAMSMGVTQPQGMNSMSAQSQQMFNGVSMGAGNTSVSGSMGAGSMANSQMFNGMSMGAANTSAAGSMPNNQFGIQTAFPAYQQQMGGISGIQQQMGSLNLQPASNNFWQ